MSQPSVAVCIPTYNQSQYLREAVLSVCAQTYPGIEIWVSDDASTDDTPEVMAELCQQYPQIHYYRQPHNLGIAKNNNWLLRQPQTDLIVRLDSDDRLLPHYVATFVPLFQQYPEAGYGHAWVQEISETGEYLAVRRLARQELFQDATTALRAAVTGYRVAANICIFRAQALRELNYIENRPDYTEDYDLSVRMADAGYGNVFVPEILCAYRVWTDIQGMRPRRKAMEIRGLTRIYDESMIPAFQRRGWDIRPIEQRRRMMALRHAASCYLPWFTPAERAELVALLKALGDSPALRLRLLALDCGLAPFYNWRHRMEMTFKGQVKGWLSAVQSWKGELLTQ